MVTILAFPTQPEQFFCLVKDWTSPSVLPVDKGDKLTILTNAKGSLRAKVVGKYHDLSREQSVVLIRPLLPIPNANEWIKDIQKEGWGLQEGTKAIDGCRNLFDIA